MGGFAVVCERSSRSLEKVGWFRVEGDMIEIYTGWDRVVSGREISGDPGSAPVRR